MSGGVASASGQTPGALYELIARGEKDAYFFAEPSQGAFSPFANQYLKVAQHISETKLVGPINDAKFGGTVEFEIERFADILTDIWFTVDLPSWIPPSILQRDTSKYVDSDGAAHNYISHAGFFLIEQLQLLQGQMIIGEYTGDTLYFTAGMHRRGAQADLVRELGSRGRVRIPFPGCQGDREGSFPLCAVPDKAYKIRIKLRKFEDLLADRTLGSPLGRAFYDMSGTGVGAGASAIAFTALEKLPDLTVRLELTEAYLTREARQAILEEAATRQIHIPFISWTDQSFQLRADGRKPYLIEGRNLSEAIIVYARSRDATSLLDISSTVIDRMGFTVSGREREEEWDFNAVWSGVMRHAKNICSGGTGPAAPAQINWSLGDVHRSITSDPMQRRPEGTLNFSEADKPTLYLTPAASYRADPPVIVHVAVEGWRVYEIRSGGYGRVTFV
jgi:hypothetical protein